MKRLRPVGGVPCTTIMHGIQDYDVGRYLGPYIMFNEEFWSPGP